jgi:hypothetical protein
MGHFVGFLDGILTFNPQLPVFPVKKIISRTFRISGTVIVTGDQK